MDKLSAILNNLPDRVYKKEDSNIYHILSSISEELEDIVQNISSIEDSFYIDSAQGSDLDKLGQLFNLRRLSGEQDEFYRARIRSRLSSFIGGGTKAAIKETIKLLLEKEAKIIEHYRPGLGLEYFHNGIINGFSLSIQDSLVLRISDGIGYIGGTRITSDERDLILPENPSNRIDYIFMQSDGTLIIKDNDIVLNNEFKIGEAIIENSQIINTRLRRFYLNPSRHFITNKATISVVVPLDIDEQFQREDDVMDILQHTKAAGIALLLRNSYEIRDKKDKINHKTNFYINSYFMNKIKKPINNTNIKVDKTFKSRYFIDENMVPKYNGKIRFDGKENYSKKQYLSSKAYLSIKKNNIIIEEEIV